MENKQKIRLTDVNVMRQIIKTNLSNMPEKIAVIQITVDEMENGRLFATSRVVNPRENNELFYLNKTAKDKAVRTIMRGDNNKPLMIEAMVERFSEAYIEVRFNEKTSKILKEGIYKFKNTFFIKSPTNSKYMISLYDGRAYELNEEKGFVLKNMQWYGVDNSHCSAIATAGDLKSKNGFRKISLYATYGVENFSNAEWSRSVHHGMYECLLESLGIKVVIIPDDEN